MPYEFKSWTTVFVALGLYVAYRFYQAYASTRVKQRSTGKKVAAKDTFLATIKDFFASTDRYPKDIRDKGAGGPPQFYNEADHTRGRFAGWVRTPEDKSDVRKVQNGFYRASLNIDVKYFWFFPGHKRVLTPCVFRPGIDSNTIGPGEEEGIPPEGLVIFKRSLDGLKLAPSSADRYRNLMLDEKHKNGVLADMIINMKDKERLAGLGDASKEATDEMETKMKRTRKVHDVAAGRGEPNPMTSPYSQEMYGQEGLEGGGPATPESVWKFEG